MNIDIPRRWQPLIDRLVASGRYSSEDEVVAEGLRLVEEREATSGDAAERLRDLQSALIEGEQSGPATPFDFDAFIQSRRGSRNERLYR